MWSMSFDWKLFLFRRALALSIIACQAVLPSHAAAEVIVDVSKEYRYVSRGELTIGAYTIVPFGLGYVRKGSVADFKVASSSKQPYAVEVLPTNKLVARLNELNSFLAFWKRSPKLKPVPMSPQTTIFNEEGEYSAILISDNWQNWFGSDTAHVEYGIRTPLSADERVGLQNDFGHLADLINRTFDVSFTIYVVPCGFSNARSERRTGDIFFCTERQTDSAFSDPNTGAMILISGTRDAIFFHELGHTLLSRWKMTGADTEIVADQFALFMLLHFVDGPHLAHEWEASLRQDSNPPWEMLQIQLGDLHPPNIQRANQLKHYLDDPVETNDFLDHWSNLVYPYMRTDYLRRLATSAAPKVLVTNARAALRARGEHL
jgi:Putative metallopeptidase